MSSESPAWALVITIAPPGKTEAKTPRALTCMGMRANSPKVFMAWGKYFPYL